MPTILFLALAGVYVLGVAGVVVSGSIVEPAPDVPGSLEERLAGVRATTSAESTSTTH
jgi:hypothetical protein